MKLADFYVQLGLPESALLDKKIFKRMILDHGELTTADKRALSEDVQQIIWKYALTPSTVTVLPYEDAEREYLEIALIEVELTRPKHAERIGEIVQRAIPYPVLLVLNAPHGFSLSVAHKRFSLAEKGKIVFDDHLLTPWIAKTACESDVSFCDSMAFHRLPQTDFLAMYSQLVRSVVARNCAELTGRFEVESELSDLERREALSDCEDMKRQIASLKTAIHKEDQFAQKVELNTKIKDTEARLHAMQARL